MNDYLLLRKWSELLAKSLTHGDSLHRECIYHTISLCHDKGYEPLDPTWLAKKDIYPGIPDVYVRIPVERTSSNGRKTTDYMDYIIEIETADNVNKIALKRLQFKSSPKHDLIIIQVSGMRKQENWIQIREFIRRRLP